MIVAGILAALGLVAGIAGNVSASNQKKKAETQAKKDLDARQKRLSNYYSQEMGVNVLDTASVKSTLAMLRDRNKKAVESTNNNTVKNGATHEAKVALASNLNDSYAQAASKIAGYGEDRRRQLEQMRFNDENQISRDKSAIDTQSLMDKADSAAAWGNLAGSTLGSAASLFASMPGKTNVKGNNALASSGYITGNQKNSGIKIDKNVLGNYTYNSGLKI